MTWDRNHSMSESWAIEAEAAIRTGDRKRAEELYRQAATAEVDAFNDLPLDKERTRGITAVSSVALWYKAQEFTDAERLAHSYLGKERLPLFAKLQLRQLLQMIWTASAAEGIGVRFVPGDVLVSVKGGQVIYGGAPLDLIVRKVEGIQAVLFRTVEMLLRRPFRRRGAPESDIQSMFKPWLVQAPAGSYQFAVRMQEPDQMGLWEADRPRVEQVNATFLKILRASTTDPEHELPTVVDDIQYREAFLSLSRNLSPTGKTFPILKSEMPAHHPTQSPLFAQALDNNSMTPFARLSHLAAHRAPTSRQLCTGSSSRAP